MRRAWASLLPHEFNAFQLTTAFLNNRLAEQETVNWALNLKPTQRVERIALQDLLNSPNARDLKEPWATAWHLIEESWGSALQGQNDGTAIYGVQKRLRANDRSGAVIGMIVSLVAPYLKVEQIEHWQWQFVTKPRKPKNVGHVLSANITSAHLADLSVLELAKIDEISFLKALAAELEAAVNHGLEIARRLGWAGQGSFYKLGFLYRVYQVRGGTTNGHSGDPDAHHRGIAPSVKLLHSVVARIAELDPLNAKPIIMRWRFSESPVHIRLWAALARNEQLASADEVASLLMSLHHNQFWDLHGFPEIAELRALRFGGFDANTQNTIVKRIRKTPPRSYWPKGTEANRVKDGQLYFAVRELRRIEVRGWQLPFGAKSWLDNKIAQFGGLPTMTVDEGFSAGSTVRSVPRNPDNQYDTLFGMARLRALETAFASNGRDWDDDPAGRARDWLQQSECAVQIVRDFETTGNGGNDFPNVWNRFGWAHSPRPEDQVDKTPRNRVEEATRVLRLLNQLSNKTILSAIDGISAWLDGWSKEIKTLQLLLPVWLKIWPIAVEATNSRPAKADDTDFSVTARVSGDDSEAAILDTLNTPAGKLVGVFLAVCPTLSENKLAFAEGTIERQMRDAVIASTQQSNLIAKHRMIESLPYFLSANNAWAQINLVVPLLNNDNAALSLWRAVARQTQFTEVIEVIGHAMADRATDPRLNRESRKMLVFSLVIEVLSAFKDARNPALPNSRVTQMLRTVDDEVRASAANAIQRFVRDVSQKQPANQKSEAAVKYDSASAAALFGASAWPFINQVWPQERSLATPGVSKAFADLPAASGDAFVQATDTITRFLVPFECWSIHDYGLYSIEGDLEKLSIINDEPKAKALLNMLDLTVGTAEGAVIPYDLADALDQIEVVAPALRSSSAFRRLSAAARR